MTTPLLGIWRPKTVPRPFQNVSKTHRRPNFDFSSILHRFWDPFFSISHDFGMPFWAFFIANALSDCKFLSFYHLCFKWLVSLGGGGERSASAVLYDLGSIFLLFAESRIIEKTLFFIIFSWFWTSQNRCEIAKHLFIDKNDPRAQILSKSIDFWIPVGPPWDPNGVLNHSKSSSFLKNAILFPSPDLFFATCFSEVL